LDRFVQGNCLLSQEAASQDISVNDRMDGFDIRCARWANDKCHLLVITVPLA